jgi:hypothetical protein
VSEKLTSSAPTGSLEIVSVTADPDTVPISGQSNLSCTVDNPSGGELTYSWQAYRGSIAGNGSTARYFGSYCCAGTDWVYVVVRNERGEQDTQLHIMTVLLN